MPKAKTKTIVVQRPCWYKVVEIGPDRFDDEILSHLYGDDDDTELALSSASIDALGLYVEKTYANENTDTNPITKQPHLLRTSWCADDWRLLMTYDVDKKRFIMWRKGTYESIEDAPIEPEVSDADENGDNPDE
jgi:hypothetical protein